MSIVPPGDPRPGKPLDDGLLARLQVSISISQLVHPFFANRLVNLIVKVGDQKSRVAIRNNAQSHRIRYERKRDGGELLWRANDRANPKPEIT